MYSCEPWRDPDLSNPILGDNQGNLNTGQLLENIKNYC